jgi:hypothetical protein
MELYPWILIDLRNLNSKLNRRNMESLKKEMKSIMEQIFRICLFFYVGIEYQVN